MPCFRKGCLKSLALPGLLACVAWTCATARAETFPLSFVAPPNLLPPASERLDALAREHADGMYRNLMQRIDEADRACRLSDEQKLLLRVAAKGAVQDCLEGWLQPILSTLATGSEKEREAMRAQLLMVLTAGQNVVVMQMPVRIDGKIVNDVVVVQRAAVDRDGNPVPKRPDQFLPPLLKLDDRIALHHVIFLSAIESVLTDEQEAKLQGLDARRMASVVRSRKDRLLDEIRTSLSLTDEQCAEVDRLLDVIDSPQLKLWCRGESETGVSDAVRLAIPLFPAKEMERFLSPVQYDIWSDLSRQIRANAEFQRGLPNRPEVILDGPLDIPPRIEAPGLRPQ